MDFGLFRLWESFNKYSFELSTIALLTTGFTVARYAFQDSVKTFVESRNIISKKNSIKFSESAWKFLFYSSVWIWGISLALNEDYFWNTFLCIKDYPNIEMSDALQIFYLTELSFYMSSFLCHVTIEVRRKDYWQMLLHHVAAFFLIAMSYIMKTHRYGLVLLVLHDVNDIFLELGKLFIYHNSTTIANVIFGMFIASWLTTRICLFSYKVLYSTLIEAYPVAVATNNIPYWIAINVLLYFLQGLNFMWFGMMLKVLKRVICGEKIKDSREEGEETK